MTFHHEYVWFSCFSSAFAGFPASDPYTPLCIERMQRFLFALLAVPILPCNAHAATYTQGTYTAHAQGTYNATYSQILPCNAHAATYTQGTYKAHTQGTYTAQGTGHIQCNLFTDLTMQCTCSNLYRAHTLHRAQGTYTAQGTGHIQCNLYTDLTMQCTCSNLYTGHIHCTCTGHIQCNLYTEHTIKMHMQQPIHRAHTMQIHRARTLHRAQGTYNATHTQSLPCNAHAATYTQGIADRTL